MKKSGHLKMKRESNGSWKEPGSDTDLPIGDEPDLGPSDMDSDTDRQIGDKSDLRPSAVVKI